MHKKRKKMYPSDLTDKQWALIKDYFKRPDPRGAASKYSKRSIMNAILYVVKGGIQCRMLPKDMPKWQAVYDHFRRLRERGIWDQILIDLTKKYRFEMGRNENPSYSLIDTQTVKTQYKGDLRGYDGGKKIKVRKRAISTDTMGNLLFVKVCSAKESDTMIGRDITYQTFKKFSSIRAFCADQ